MIVSSRIKRFLVGALMVVPFLFLCCSAGWGAGDDPFFLPGTDRRSGEEFFVAAYRELAEGRYRKALDWLEKALARDPYLIEYYLLRGYCLSHLGDPQETLESLRLYLDVRDSDPSAEGFLRETERRAFLLEKYLSGGDDSVPHVSPVLSLDSALGLSPLSTRGFRMPGHPCRIGNFMTFCDTAKETLKIYRRKEGNGKEESWKRVFSEKVGPVVRALPLGKGEFVLFLADGMMKRISFELGEYVLSEGLRVTEGIISDADLASGHLAVVADRTSRSILFVDCLTGEVRSSWAPGPDDFEPVSVAVLGPLVAVADRGGNKVRVFDSVSGENIRVHEMGAVRGVAWLDSGRLIAVSEEGKLEMVLLEGGAVNLFDEFPQAWFLFRDGSNSVVLTDTKLYRAVRVTPTFERGFLTLSSPVFLDIDGDVPFLSVEARVLQPLGVAREEQEAVIRGVWGGEVLDIRALHRTQGLTSRVVRIPSEEVREVFPGTELPQGTDILLVDVKDFPRDAPSLVTLGYLALANGFPVYFLADREVPTLEEVRLGELSGGGILLSTEGIAHLRPAEMWDLYLQAEPGIALPGDPEDGGLFVRGRIGTLEMEARIPLWTALLPIEERPGVTSADIYGENVEDNEK